MNFTVNYMQRNCSEARPCSYFKHMHFIDFELYGLKNPLYINLVRHPVERVVSW